MGSEVHQAVKNTRRQSWSDIEIQYSDVGISLTEARSDLAGGKQSPVIAHLSRGQMWSIGDTTVQYLPNTLIYILAGPNALGRT